MQGCREHKNDRTQDSLKIWFLLHIYQTILKLENVRHGHGLPFYGTPDFKWKLIAYISHRFGKVNLSSFQRYAENILESFQIAWKCFCGLFVRKLRISMNKMHKQQFQNHACLPLPTMIIYILVPLRTSYYHVVMKWIVYI